MPHDAVNEKDVERSAIILSLIQEIEKKNPGGGGARAEGDIL